MLQFGVAGALSAAEEGEAAVTDEQIDTLVNEIREAAASGAVAASVGVGGRKATQRSQGGFSAETAAQAAAALGGEAAEEAPEEKVDVAQAAEALGRGSRDRQSRFFQVRWWQRVRWW